MVRKLRKSDLKALEGLYSQFWGESSDLEAMERSYSNLAYRDDYILLAYEADGKVAGSVMGVVCSELYGDCRPYLVMENLIVDRSFRGRGIGRSLVEALEAAARDRDCCQILFITERDRADAVGFYEFLGFDSVKNVGYKRKL